MSSFKNALISVSNFYESSSGDLYQRTFLYIEKSKLVLINLIKGRFEQTLLFHFTNSYTILIATHTLGIYCRGTLAKSLETLIKLYTSIKFYRAYNKKQNKMFSISLLNIYIFSKITITYLKLLHLHIIIKWCKSQYKSMVIIDNKILTKL